MDGLHLLHRSRGRFPFLRAALPHLDGLLGGVYVVQARHILFDVANALVDLLLHLREGLHGLPQRRLGLIERIHHVFLDFFGHIAGGAPKGPQALPQLLGKGRDLVRPDDEQDHHEYYKELTESKLQIPVSLLKKPVSR